MRYRKRVVTESNSRHMIPTRVISPHRMSPPQINKVNKAISNKRIIKPIKVYRPRVANPNILLDIPLNCGKNSLEYPTPEWFRRNEPADVSVIIPMYKSNNVVGDLIKSWLLNDGIKWEIIFVDDSCPNNSKDVVIQNWAARRPLHQPVGRIIYNTETKGYGQTCNVGAEHASGEYLIFLNADTTVTPGWIDPIVKLLRQPDVGLVGNLQIKEGGMWNGHIDSAGSEWSWERDCFDHIGRHIYHGRALPEPMKPELAPPDVLNDGVREMVTGCCFGIRRDLFRYIGGFNPNYRIGYWEDAELSLFVRELGYKVMFTSKSIIHHKLSHTNSGAHPFAEFNKQYFKNRWVKSGRIDPLIKFKRPQIPPVRSVLLRRSGAHGDVLVAAGVAMGLKKKYQGCQIIFQTDCPNVLNGHPYIDRVANHESVSERQFQVFYDLDMAYEYRPRTNILDAYAEFVGVKTSDCDVCINTEFIDMPTNSIVMHAGNTAWSGRNWEPSRFAEVASILRSMGHIVTCVGTKGDYLVPCDVDLRGNTSIKQLAHVIKNSKLFVGIDSMPMHVAQAVRTPGVCFFGSIIPSTRIYRDNMYPITANIACLGCHHRKPVPCVLTNTCEIKDQQCISLITVDMMVDKILNVLT
jgi:GT2 family glycosyltransferase